ncbi:MAG TPA: PEGA domain-containing protein, partial [Candidatus Desulfofervidus auxilii]|nr:PEGA domain-containing protein [Candidatus Desulfofervidus auxilii]
DYIEVTVTQIDINPNESAPVTIIISSTEERLINSKVTVSRGSERVDIPVIVSVIKPKEAKKEVKISIFPSGITTSLVQGTVRDEIIQIQNIGKDDLDLSATVSGGISLPDGTVCPAYIKEFSSGILKPGEKRTMTLGIIGKVEPGTYTNKILLQYAPGEVVQIPIQLTVLSAPTPTENRTLKIITYPEENYKVGDVLYISTIDDKGNPVIATITVVQNDNQGNKIKEFRYTIPFKLEPGIYTITAEAEGYNIAEKIIELEELDTELVITPSNPTTADTITIVYQTPEGKLVEDATIIVDNTSYSDSQISLSLPQGTHRITANAPGYKEQSKSITVQLKLEIIIPKPTIESGEQEIVEFNKNVSYEIKRVEDGKEVAIDYGRGDKFVFKEEKPGTYNIYVDNKLMGTITVEKKSIGIDLDIFWWVAGGVIALILIYLLFGGKKPKMKKEKYLIRDVRQVRGALGTEKIKEEE